MYKLRQESKADERQTHHEPNVAASPVNGAIDGRFGIGCSSQSGTAGAYDCGGTGTFAPASSCGNGGV